MQEPTTAAERFRAERARKRDEAKAARVARKKAKARRRKPKKRGRPKKLTAEQVRQRAIAQRRSAEFEARESAARLRVEQRTSFLASMSPAVSDDPFVNADEILRAIAYSMRSMLLDDSLSPAEQRAELRAIAKTYQSFIPDSRRLAAERAVRGALERAARPKADPKTTKAPVGGAPLQMSPQP